MKNSTVSIFSSLKHRSGLLLPLFCMAIFFSFSSSADLSDLAGLDQTELEQLQVSDENYSRLCAGKTRDWGGFAHIGGAGFACDAKAYGDADLAEIVYRDYFVERNLLLAQAKVAKQLKSPSYEFEKTRYTSRIVGLLEKIGREYIKRRRGERPVSTEEMDAWIRGNLTRVYQETLFSHYRIGATKDLKSTGPRFLVGDPTNPKNKIHFKSMGISQINIQAHNDMIPGAAYFDLMKNIIEGYEHFYRLWMRARVALINHQDATGKLRNCASHIKSYDDVVKSAYSAYTGGGFCRWYRSPILKKSWETKNDCKFPIYRSKKERYNFCKDSYRKTQVKLHWNNDLDFAVKYKYLPWSKYVNENMKVVNLDINCIFEGDHLCLIPSERRDQYLRNHILIKTNNSSTNGNEKLYCVLEDRVQRLHCVKEPEAINCLQSKSKISAYKGILSINGTQYDRLSSNLVIYKSKYNICSYKENGIFPPGSIISPLRRVNIRKNPWVPAKSSNSNRIGTVSTQTAYQVLDYTTQPGSNSSRWYKISFAGKDGPEIGFVFAGKLTQGQKNWKKYFKPASLEQAKLIELFLPIKGSKFTSKAPAALKLIPIGTQNSSERVDPFLVFESKGLTFVSTSPVVVDVLVTINWLGTDRQINIGSFQIDKMNNRFVSTISRRIQVIQNEGI